MILFIYNLSLRPGKLSMDTGVRVCLVIQQTLGGKSTENTDSMATRGNLRSTLQVTQELGSASTASTSNKH